MNLLSRPARWIAMASLMLTAAWVRLAAAQQPQEGFVPVSPDQLGQEALPAAPLVFAAYAFVWVGLIVYVFLLWRRLGRVERELTELSARIARSSK